jgi:apolipoprotein D and lipocalin family protein
MSRVFSRALVLLAAFAVSGCVSTLPSRQAPVPAPAKSVDLARYQGKWFELARYEASFQRGCEGVTAEYTPLADGTVRVVNRCRQGSVNGMERSAEALARVVPGTGNAQLKVTFFWPFEGDYWVLDRADDYSWAIIGEPSGQYLWLLSRKAVVPERDYQRLVSRAAGLGYDVSLLRRTAQPPAPPR